MNRSIVRTLTGLVTRRGAAAAAVLATAVMATPANAWSVRLCAMGDGWGIWVTVTYESASGNYDPTTNSGVIDFTAFDGQGVDDFLFTDIPGSDGLPTTLRGPADMVMGTYEVVGGLGTEVCELSWPDIWVTGDGWGVHLILSAGSQLSAPLQLTGFTPDGEGVYGAQGLSIPVDFEFVRPDGTTVVVPHVIDTLEFRSPLSLTPPPCAADCDGNGTLNVDDIDCFVASFLGGCL
ncbi:MAG: hypothetical protein DHS20C14_11750 [Phycisphaeraceae bacterium]|nr:MAG: hypothetical protein DHS20C14_11750 [Phycisphaeraceae bacterium]